jgi:hypothetical protein
MQNNNLQWPGSDPRSDHVEYVMDKQSDTEVDFLWELSPANYHSSNCSISICHALVNTTQCQS